MVLVKYSVSRADKYSLAVRYGLSQRAVSNLGFKPCKMRKSQNTPGGVRAKAPTPLPLPTNIYQLLRLTLTIKIC